MFNTLKRLWNRIEVTYADISDIVNLLNYKFLTGRGKILDAIKAVSHGRAVAQAVRRWLAITGVRIQVRFNS
jgi:hypothetical protein